MDFELVRISRIMGALFLVSAFASNLAQAACPAGTNAPTIVNPPTITTPKNTPVTLLLEPKQNPPGQINTYTFVFTALDQIGTGGWGSTGTSANGGAISFVTGFPGKVSYTPPTGFVGADYVNIAVAPSCDPTLISIYRIQISVGSNIVGTYSSCVTSTSCPTGSVGGPGTGISVIIVDNTPNPNTPGVVTNMATNAAAVMRNLGQSNEIEVKLSELQVMQRDAKVSPHDLIDDIGANNANSTSYQNFYNNARATYFASGSQLFDLDKMRRAAEWMSLNVPPLSPSPATCTYPVLPGGTYHAYTTAAQPFNNGANSIARDADGTPVPRVGTCHLAATYTIDPAITSAGGNYGTISWAQFVHNVANSITMYGIVRVLVPAQAGTAIATTNALGTTPLPGVTGVPDPIYGKCATATTRTLCLNPPSVGIKPGSSIVVTDWSGVPHTETIPANPQVRVRGSLFFDFVDGQKNYPTGVVPGIGLGQLPNGKELKFAMWLPINVNAGNDRDGDGIMDNLEYIESLSAGVVCSNPTGPSFPCSYRFKTSPPDLAIDPNQVPQEAVDAYNAQFNTTYRDSADPAFQTKFRNLNLPNQYHLLMPSAYAQGWADAFAELNISSTQWSNLGFLVPAQHVAPLSVAEIRSSGFEDLPVYLYSGGTADLGNHINISGLMYIPQSIELEVSGGGVSTTGTSLFSKVRQFIMGGIIVRDGFELESQAKSIQVISSDPLSFATARVSQNAVSGSMLVTSTGTLHNTSVPVGVGVGGGTPTTGCTGDCTVVGSPNIGNVGKVRWVEVRPQASK